jgi:hypothetical protein
MAFIRSNVNVNSASLDSRLHAVHPSEIVRDKLLFNVRERSCGVPTESEMCHQ